MNTGGQEGGGGGHGVRNRSIPLTPPRRETCQIEQLSAEAPRSEGMQGGGACHIELTDSNDILLPSRGVGPPYWHR